jgi:alkylated DNA nucleotide flippase Atl1
MDPALIRMVEFLNREQIRATYDAVAHAAGVPTRSVGRLLGDRCELASWVVNGGTGEPTGYTRIDKHPALYERKEIIRDGDELIRRMRSER